VLIDIAMKWPNPYVQTPRIVLNLRFIVPFFHAVQVEFYRASADGFVTPPQLLSSLASILEIAPIVYENEHPNSMCRIAWPLFVAGIETTNFAHQSWILDRYRALSNFGSSFRRAHDLLKAVISHQRQTGERVDFRDWVRNRPEFESFII
jgi:hypothetical protein